MLNFKSHPLVDFIGDRANNFTVIRLVLAVFVLFGHSFPIVGAGYDPISLNLLSPITWLGAVSVNCFFGISGFLISFSAEKNKPLAFIQKRLLRIYPALLAYIIISIFLIGPFISNLSGKEYWRFDSIRNLLFSGFTAPWYFVPPEVFSSNPFPNSYNGSLWTIPLELLSYGVVFVIYFGRVFRSNIVSDLGLLAFALVLIYTKGDFILFGFEERAIDPIIYFLLGMLAYRHSRQFRLNFYYLLAFLAVAFILQPLIGATAWAPLSLQLIFIVAYRLPEIGMDKFGDFSYGLYIWAWPIQQVLFTSGQSPYVNFLSALVVTVPIAVLSWFLIEKPSLKFAKFLGARGG